MKKTFLLLMLVCAAFLLPASASSHATSLQTSIMPYPFWVAPEDGDIYHIPTGLKLSFEGMMEMISGSRLVYVGETHTNIHAHRVQLEILRELERRFPGRIALGMEMFRTPQQKSLDRWVKGDLTETGFLKESGWYGNWQSDFRYYRDILTFARDNRIDVVALNPPRELQHHLAMSASKGEKMPEELAQSMPEIDSSDKFQRATMKAIFGGHAGSHSLFDPFFKIQLLWEETMASRITAYLSSAPGEGKIMVVLAGGMHVEYGFGVPKKVLRRLPLPYSIVLSAATHIPEEKKERVLMDVDIPEIPLLRSDFIWMIPYEDYEDEQVKLGILMTSREGGGVGIKEVVADSAAEAAGIEAGDGLISLDGYRVEDMSDVILKVRSKKVGDSITIVVERAGELHTLTTTFEEKKKEAAE